MPKYMMALDSGTTSNRCILFDHSGAIVSLAQREFSQHFPQPGWVEHDAGEIWATLLGVTVEAMQMAGATAADIAAIGITNQRETTIVWDKVSPSILPSSGSAAEPVNIAIRSARAASRPSSAKKPASSSTPIFLPPSSAGSCKTSPARRPGPSAGSSCSARSKPGSSGS